MIETKTPFYSEGLRLDASLYLPDGGAPAGRPLVLACSGFLGLNRIHPARFARALTPRGWPCFGFDYRGFGTSAGTPGRVLLEEQVVDIAAAAAFAASLPEAAGRPLVLLGWGMGAGLVLEAAPLAPRLAGLAGLNGFYDGRRVQEAVRGPDGFRAFLDRVRSWRRESSRSGKEPDVDPFEIYPLDEQCEGYVDGVLRKVPGFGGTVKPVLADSLLRFRAEGAARALRTPLFLAHGRENRTHPPAEAEALHAAWSGPKELHRLPGGHTEWMDDAHPTFVGLVEKLAAWLDGLPGTP